MRGCVTIFLLCVLIFVGQGRAAEATFKQSDGTVLQGELTAPNETGFVLKIDGKFQPRTPWNTLSQETLLELQKDPKLKKFVDLLVSPSGDSLIAAAKAARPPKPQITIKPVERAARITPKPGMIAGLMSPLGLLIFLSFWGTNVYAGYEVAVFRKREAKVVCGVSALAPVVGPLVFLCLPPPPEPEDAIVAAASRREGDPEPVYQNATVGAPMTEEPEAPKRLETVVYRRGEFTFNRRFIETKFAGFFRLVPSEAEKNLILVFVTARGEYAGRRLSKVTQTDFQLVIQKDGAFSEVTIPLNDILEIQVRPNDA